MRFKDRDFLPTPNDLLGMQTTIEGEIRAVSRDRAFVDHLKRNHAIYARSVGQGERVVSFSTYRKRNAPRLVPIQYYNNFAFNVVPVEMEPGREVIFYERMVLDLGMSDELIFPTSRNPLVASVTNHEFYGLVRSLYGELGVSQDEKARAMEFLGQNDYAKIYGQDSWVRKIHVYMRWMGFDQSLITK